MSAQHTPGPWLAEPADMFCDHNIILADSREDARAIAAVVSNVRDPHEVAANAALIAAAPDLYEILVRLDRLGGLGLGVHDCIREALAKARGESADILSGVRT